MFTHPSFFLLIILKKIKTFLAHFVSLPLGLSRRRWHLFNFSEYYQGNKRWRDCQIRFQKPLGKIHWATFDFRIATLSVFWDVMRTNSVIKDVVALLFVTFPWNNILYSSLDDSRYLLHITLFLSPGDFRLLFGENPSCVFVNLWVKVRDFAKGDSEWEIRLL